EVLESARGSRSGPASASGVVERRRAAGALLRTTPRQSLPPAGRVIARINHKPVHDLASCDSLPSLRQLPDPVADQTHRFLVHHQRRDVRQPAQAGALWLQLGPSNNSPNETPISSFCGCSSFPTTLIVCPTLRACSATFADPASNVQNTRGTIASVLK